MFGIFEELFFKDPVQSAKDVSQVVHDDDLPTLLLHFNLIVFLSEEIHFLPITLSLTELSSMRHKEPELH